MPQRISALNIYIIAISIAGFVLNFWGIVSLLPFVGEVNFWLLLGLAVAAAGATTSVGVSDEAGITYHVVPAVSLAATSAFGLFGGVLLGAVAFLVVWVAKPRSENWKKSLRQLAFNAGSDSISIFAASAILLWFSQATTGNLWGLAGWILATVVFESLSATLLAVVLRLQHGAEFNTFQAWKEMQWTMGLELLVTALGGWMLSYAITAYDWRGILIFFMPILLSAYAFRLYISKVSRYMENLEEIVDKRTQELADMNRQKDTMLTVLTHDMITPLTSIRLCTEMLNAKSTTLPEILPVTQLIMHNQRVLIDLAHNIMDVEKLQAGVPIFLEKEQVEMGALIRESIDILTMEAESKQVELSYELGEEPLPIVADRRQMQRILLNLLSNAIKYTPEKGSAWIRARREDGHLIMEIEDNGYGIDPDELPTIFERFMRASQMQGKVTGTGIGLAVVKSLVNAHDGEVSVTSELNKGTLFTVKIPV